MVKVDVNSFLNCRRDDVRFCSTARACSKSDKPQPAIENALRKKDTLELGFLHVYMQPES